MLGLVSSTARKLTIAAVLGLSLASISVPTMSFARGPEDIADLAETVSDAVVNISTTQTVESARNIEIPQLPPGTPFSDLFEEFFNKRGMGPGAPGGEKRREKVSSLGSGFVIDESGIVITNNHVIKDADEIFVNFSDGSKLKAELIGKDPKTDVAVLRIKPTKTLKAVKFGNSEKMRVGEWVVAIGNPFGLGGTVTAGIISARNRDINAGPYDNFIQTDAAINKGNSGGPLFNLEGEVIGINTAIFSTTGGSIGIGFAIPAATAIPVIEQLQKFGETRRGWLGVRIQPVTEEIAESLGLKTTKGALVSGIETKGPAKPAGLEPGDLIIKFDGKDVKETRDLPRLVADTPVGKEVEVTIIRKGKEMTRKVTLGRLEDGEKLAAAEAGTPVESPEGSKTVAGLSLSPLSEDLRARYKISDRVSRGLVITAIDPQSKAADKRLSAGDIIQDIGQEPVKTVQDVVSRLQALKNEGRKSALLLVSNPQGDLRFITLAVE
jgi:serine protease Do